MTYRVKACKADGRLIREISNSPYPVRWDSDGRVTAFRRDGTPETISGFAVLVCVPEGSGADSVPVLAANDYP
jgi:hypothetical protein